MAFETKTIQAFPDDLEFQFAHENQTSMGIAFIFTIEPRVDCEKMSSGLQKNEKWRHFRKSVKLLKNIF